MPWKVQLAQLTPLKANNLALVLSTTISVAIVHLFCIAVYRFWFHPLAKQPGPFLGKLSAFLNWYHAVKGDRHLWLHRQHAVYGDTVRFAPEAVSFNTTSAVDTIYRSRKPDVIKSDWYQTVRDSAGGFESTFTARDKTRHGIKRRLLSHAFSERALKDYEPRIASLVGTWLECLQGEIDSGRGDIDMGKWCDYLIFDILGDLCFGKAFGVMASVENRSIVGLVSRATEGWYKLGYHPFTHALRFLLFKTPLGPLVGGKAFRENARFRSFCLQALQERRKAETAQAGSLGTKASQDMFYHLLNGRDPETGQGYSTGDLACESVLLIVAGSQSTSGALAAAVFYLAHNPDKLAKLKAELHDNFKGEQEIRYTVGGNLIMLPYLRACIDESMRLTPPTPGHLPREVLAKEGLHVDGNWFPKGTTVGTSAYAIHRNKAYFSDPYRFWPERWIDDTRFQAEREHEASPFNAFSAGSTGCIGKQLAYMELSLAIARLAWRFDFNIRPSQSENVEYGVQDVFVGRGEGPCLQLVLASST